MIWLTVVFIQISAAAADRDLACRVLCLRDNYDDGEALKRGCVCLTVKEDFEDFARGRVTVRLSNERKVRVLQPPEPERSED